jgi:hypothetical protein
LLLDFEFALPFADSDRRGALSIKLENIALDRAASIRNSSPSVQPRREAPAADRTAHRLFRERWRSDRLIRRIQNWANSETVRGENDGALE